MQTRSIEHSESHSTNECLQIKPMYIGATSADQANVCNHVIERRKPSPKFLCYEEKFCAESLVDLDCSITN